MSVQQKAGKFLWGIINVTLISALVLMVVLVFVNAFLRYFLNSGVPEFEEISRYLFVWVTALGAIVAFRENRHIGVDFVLNALKGKVKRNVIILGQTLMAISFGMVLWGGVEYFHTSSSSPGPATGLPFGFVASSIIVVSLAVIAMSVSKIAAAVRGRQ